MAKLDLFGLQQAARDREAERIQGLLGSVYQPAITGSDRMMTSLGALPASTTPAVEGSGYLGSDRGADAQQRLLVGAQQAGYSPQQAMGLLQPEQRQQTQQQDFNKLMLQERVKSGGLEAVNRLRAPYEKAVAAPRKAMNNYNDAVDLMTDAEFRKSSSGVEMLSGAESVALTKKYLKQILPDESVMGDDIQTLLSSQGVTEQMKSFLNRIWESGTVSKTGATEIMKAMSTMAQSESVKRDRARTQYTTEAEQYQLPTTFMGERIKLKENPLGFEAWKKSKGY